MIRVISKSGQERRMEEERARARTEKSVSVDAVITLVDTISSKLQLVSYDYRGLEALKLELTRFHKLILRTRFFRSNKSSFFCNLFEELRHFCLILREERRLVYVMVEEISRFRDTLKIYQRQFCESNDTGLLDIVLDKLRHVDDNQDLGKLRVEINLLRLLYLCERNQAGDELPFSTIIYEFYEDATQFYLMMEDSSLNHELVYLFRASLLKCCKQQFSELQSDSTFTWSIWQLIEIYESLSEALWDIYTWGQSHSKVNHFIRPIINAVTFLKTFLGVATRDILIGFHERPCLPEMFLIHCQASSVDAARLGYMCWFYREDEDAQEWHQLHSESCELVDKIRPGSGNIQVTQTCIETWSLLPSTSYRSSPPSSILLGFAGYVHDYLSQLVPVISLDQVEGLETILYHIQNTCIHDEGTIHRLMEVTAIVFQLCMLSRKDKMSEELEVRILQLLGNNTSRTTCMNGMSQLLGGPYRGILTKRSFPRLIVNGVVVGYGVRRTEQIKYELLRDSRGLDLIAVVGLVANDKMRMVNLEVMVYDETHVFKHFKVHARVSLDGQYERKRLLWNILALISPTKSYSTYDEASEEYLARGLYECLKGNRYLIVLFDVPSDQAWRDLMPCFPKEGNQSKILLTGSTISISDPHHFLPEPTSSRIHQAMMKMGSCFKGS